MNFIYTIQHEVDYITVTYTASNEAQVKNILEVLLKGTVDRADRKSNITITVNIAEEEKAEDDNF